MSEKNTGTDKLDALDQAIAEARKAGAEKSKTKKAAVSEDGTAPKRVKLTDEERAARKEKLEQERAARKAEREQARAAKKVEKEGTRTTPHMSKVTKAGARLPALHEDAQTAFNDLTTNLGAGDLEALAAHLQHFNRVKATERALAVKLEVGQAVRVIGGDPRYIGCIGKVTGAQRIRCYVTVLDGAGEAKDLYLFTSQVEAAEIPVELESTGTDG
ncbi:MAG: hypothetical protein WCV62_06750 [Candidatus Peribacteraceae bacterium]|jgi:hypothetical protein